ncbi:MAG: DNA-processing protein DprA [Vibrionaceae bacterium]
MNEQALARLFKLASVPKLAKLVFERALEPHNFANLDAFDDSALLDIGFSFEQIKSFRTADPQKIEQALSWAQRPDCHVLCALDPLYPYLLKQIGSAPRMLFVQGNADVLSLPQLALVGSRTATPNGLSCALEFAQELAQQGFVITSGLALGIDGRAHRGALTANGLTVAVLGSGLDVVYPKAHQTLAGEIAQSGALVSELWPWTPPRPEFFPRRNRIISGLAVGVLVIEATADSGSLITAKLALEQGRDVFALPHAIGDPFGSGCNGLIKQGAFLVESVQDVLSQVGVLSNCVIEQNVTAESSAFLSQHLPSSSLLASVGDEVTCVDVLAQRCGLPVNEIMMQLVELELQGLVLAVPGGYIKTRRSKS